MKELLKIIDEIVKYGLKPDIAIQDKERDLEKYLVMLYAKYFEVQCENDDADCRDCNTKKMFPDVIENVKRNFKDFGYYYTVLNADKVLQEAENGIGDAIDDLSDIIYDLLEIKWRKENTSENDACFYFKLLFYGHTQQHLLDLLNYMKSKDA
ncbi:MAG: hypothetical protein ACPG5B_01325 [Chitinophagales bacterium]